MSVMFKIAKIVNPERAIARSEVLRRKIWLFSSQAILGKRLSRYEGEPLFKQMQLLSPGKWMHICLCADFVHIYGGANLSFESRTGTVQK